MMFLMSGAAGRVPEFNDLGIVGLQGPGDRIGMVAFAPELADEDQLGMVEGFAEGADGIRYRWEVWTRETYEVCADGEVTDEPELIGRLDLLGTGETQSDVLEWISHDGRRWTQVVIDAPWFGVEVLERVRSAPAEERGLIFSPMPPLADD